MASVKGNQRVTGYEGREPIIETTWRIKFADGWGWDENVAQEVAGFVPGKIYADDLAELMTAYNIRDEINRKAVAAESAHKHARRPQPTEAQLAIGEICKAKKRKHVKRALAGAC